MQAGFRTPFAARESSSAADLGATPSFHRLLSRPVALGDPLGIPWGLLGTLGDSSGTPWDHLETFGDVLGSLGHALAIPWGPLTSSFGRFRCLLGILWGQLGPPRGSHGLPKGVQEACWGPRASILEASKVFTKQFAAICKNLEIYCKVLQKSRSGKTETFENQSQFS